MTKDKTTENATDGTTGADTESSDAAVGTPTANPHTDASSETSEEAADEFTGEAAPETITTSDPIPTDGVGTEPAGELDPEITRASEQSAYEPEGGEDTSTDPVSVSQSTKDVSDTSASVSSLDDTAGVATKSGDEPIDDPLYEQATVHKNNKFHTLLRWLRDHALWISAITFLLIFAAALAWYLIGENQSNGPSGFFGPANSLSRDPNQSVSDAYQKTIDVRNSSRLQKALDLGHSHTPEFTSPGTPIDNAPLNNTEPELLPPTDDEVGELETGEQEVADLGVFGTIQNQPAPEPEASSEYVLLQPSDDYVSIAPTSSVTQSQDTRKPTDGSETLHSDFLQLLFSKWDQKPEFVNTHYNTGTTTSSRSQDTENRDITAAQSANPPPETIIEAGREVYTYSRYGLNSDIRGPVVLEVLSGSLRGGVLTGTFEVTREEVLIRMSRLELGGESYRVDAYAVDLNCGCFAHEGDVDHHFLERVLIPAAAQFAQGFLLAAARPSITLDLGASSVTSRSEDTDTRDHLIEGLGQAGQRASEIYSETAPTGPTVRIAQNTEMLVVFVEPVLRARSVRATSESGG